MKEQLEIYLKQLEVEHKELRNKYKGKSKYSNCFAFDRNKKWSVDDAKRLNNIKEQKLHINRLLKLIGE